MTTLADLRLAAQQRADHATGNTSDSPWPDSEWSGWVNYEHQALYDWLCNTYQDYNVKSYAFTLPGGLNGNSIQVGFGSGIPDFFQPRAVWFQVSPAVTGGNPYVTLTRLNSALERNLYWAPAISIPYGAIPQVWDLSGNTLEVLPAQSSAGNYILRYVPSCPKLVNDTDTIDQFWTSINGWDEYIVLGVAATALAKEESDPSFLIQKQTQVRDRILKSATPRDISQPQGIVDIKRVRAGWGRGGWGGSWGGM